MGPSALDLVGAHVEDHQSFDRAGDVDAIRSVGGDELRQAAESARTQRAPVRCTGSTCVQTPSELPSPALITYRIRRRRDTAAVVFPGGPSEDGIAQRASCEMSQPVVGLLTSANTVPRASTPKPERPATYRTRGHAAADRHVDERNAVGRGRRGERVADVVEGQCADRALAVERAACTATWCSPRSSIVTLSPKPIAAIRSRSAKALAATDPVLMAR